jgi:hypothetical protein
MRLSEIERIAKDAMDACSEAIKYPKHRFVRERLFDLLAEIVDPAFCETDQSRNESLSNQLRQANVWGTIVRSRIEISRKSGSSETTASTVLYPTRDLQHVLDALLKELRGLPMSRRVPASLGNRNGPTTN